MGFVQNFGTVLECQFPENPLVEKKNIPRYQRAFIELHWSLFHVLFGYVFGMIGVWNDSRKNKTELISDMGCNFENHGCTQNFFYAG